MQIVRRIKDFKRALLEWRKEELRIALVPTMGALHDGHLSLVDKAKMRSDRVIGTSFVNPKQFSPDEDLKIYPRNEASDKIKFEKAGASLLFVPSVAEMYPSGYLTKVYVKGISDILEGKYRPHYLSGVATIVSKLLILAKPNIAIFGEKDYQQLCLVRTLVRDLNLEVEILGAPTVRELDGLAMSSRNAYLSSSQRKIAPNLFEELRGVCEIARKNGDIDRACIRATQRLLKKGYDKVDYIVCRDSHTLSKFDPRKNSGRVLGAAWLGKTRLIDNLKISNRQVER